MLAASIAGLVTFVIAVLTKEQKTSEFRQAWIDALRNDIADFLGAMSVTVSMVRAKLLQGRPKEEIAAYLLNKEEHFIKLEVLVSKIRLRANPSEHVTFLKALEEFESCAQAVDTLMDRNVTDALQKSFLKESQALLKSEWIRVKRGEPIFRFAKWGALLTLVAAITFGLIYFYLIVSI